ncbi:MAG: MFS transporter, partial [Gammaproteobacteria bacterium]|nr:MFS transporter [Gammaproteobacteria bacterium]
MSELPPLGQVMREMIGSVFVPSLLAAVAQNAIMIMLPLYALQFDGGAALAALMLGARGAGIMLADLPGGMLVSRLGDKWVMVAGLALLIAVTALAALFGSASALLVVALLSGIGTGLWIIARLAYLTDHVALEQRGRVVSVIAGVHRAGALLGPVLAGVGVQPLGYAATFLILACLYAIALLALLVSARGVRGTAA